jgi:hypothetical protein
MKSAWTCGGDVGVLYDYPVTGTLRVQAVALLEF